MQSRGKNSNLKIGVTYITLGVFLLVALISGLYIWFVFLPAFVDLIICLGVVFSIVIVYFAILRGVFLNKNSGYEITDKLLIYKDGFPNSKKYVLDLQHIAYQKMKPYKIAFLVTAIIVFGIFVVASIVLGVLLHLKFIFIFLIILLGLIISGYFIVLHFLSKPLAKCKIIVSGKTILLRNMDKEVLNNILSVIDSKGGKDEV